MTIKGCKGAVFDLDGVITETAKVHFLAWKEMFDEFLKKKKLAEFTEKDYYDYVDGKPRYDGVKSFLESRKIDLSFGTVNDDASKKTICGLGNKKNDNYQKIIYKEKPHVFESSVSLVKKLKKEGLKVGIASSSKNTKVILKLSGLTSLFDTVVDGVVSEKLKLSGKPEPDIFVKAAENMGIRPSQCIVFEDAVSGVQAGKNGSFGLVVGIKRGSGNLSAADIVVNDLKELSISRIKKWFSEDIKKNSWSIDYYNYNKDGELIREAMCAVGNGYLGTRGSHVTQVDDSKEHYPATYLSGIYNNTSSKVHGKDVWNNDLVNCPNWLLINIKIGSDKIKVFDCEIVEYHQKLDMKRGMLFQNLTIIDGKGRKTKIKSERFAGMHNQHIVGMKLKILPLNYSEKITLESYLDGNVINNNVERYRQLNCKHLNFVNKGRLKGALNLVMSTSNSKHDIVYFARNHFFGNSKKSIVSGLNSVGEQATFDAKKNDEIILEKTVSIFTSRESSNPLRDGEESITQSPSYEYEKKQHISAWSKIWKKADIVIEGDIWTQKIMRLHTYHMLCTASYHNISLDVGMPARGLHGEGYRGHVFWDELYILPFYNLRFPEISKALLRYRYRRLSGAIKCAEENGYEGAMYPWQSADMDGEETQEVHYNPNSGKWDPDLSRRQRHVSIAIFYNFWEYYLVTGDDKFTNEVGVDVMLAIARFWTSIAKKEKDGKYHIEGVMGPDEFHEKLPRKKKEGLRDNAYTNIMVSWLLEKSVGLSDKFFIKVGVSQEEVSKWKEISENLALHTKNGIIEQFEGYFGLPELNWSAYRSKYGDIHRLDRILKAEGKPPDNFKAGKQADVLMPFYILDINEVASILKRLGVKVGNPVSFFKKNYQYYEPRTSHGSTLSKIVHGVISSYMSNDKLTRELFDDAIISDISEKVRKDTSDGIHCGLMAGSVDFILRRFAGINYNRGILEINPKLPEDWNLLSFGITHKNIWFDIKISNKNIKITPNKNSEVVVGSKKLRLQKGKEKTILLKK